MPISGRRPKASPASVATMRSSVISDWLTGAETCEDRETTATSVSDDGQVITGASRLLHVGVDDGAIYTPKMGWMLLGDFLESQGVLEASRWWILGATVSGSGKTLVGTALPLAADYWHGFRLDLDQVFVCHGTGGPREDAARRFSRRHGSSPVASRLGRVLSRAGSALSGLCATVRTPAAAAEGRTRRPENLAELLAMDSAGPRPCIPSDQSAGCRVAPTLCSVLRGRM